MKYEVGDNVVIGAHGKVHWEVIHHFTFESGEQVVILQSPMSQRRRSELARYVRPWSP